MTIHSDGGIEGSGTQVPPNPSKLPAIDLFEVLKRWFITDSEFSAVWRIQAKNDFDFRSGEQWSDTDKALLNSQQRPHIVFNRVLTILKAIAGMEINGRHEIQYLPSNNAVTAPNELLSAASKWMAAGCDAEDEESEAFDNCATCGMGWTENRLSYEDDDAGLYVEESVSPLEMYWDHSVRKKNLDGAGRLARAKEIPLRDAMQLFPGKTRVQLDAVWAAGGELDKTPRSIEEKRIRNTDSGSPYDHYDDATKVMVVEMQWFEREVFYVIADDANGQKLKISEAAYKNMVRNAATTHARLNIPGLNAMPPAARMTRKVYKRAFLGSELLQSGDAPVKGRFSWACITGELDRNKGHWFGLIKTMRDPDVGQQVAEPDPAHPQHHGKRRHRRRGGCIRGPGRGRGEVGAAGHYRVGGARLAVGPEPEDHAQARRRLHPRPCRADAVCDLLDPRLHRHQSRAIGPKRYQPARHPGGTAQAGRHDGAGDAV